MMRRLAYLLLMLFGVLGSIHHVYAHANLLNSIPTANARLADPPEEIRLFFSEALESQFSRIELLDSQGTALDLANSQVDVVANQQLFLPIVNLTDGVYTVSWRIVSQTDGHLTQGSFPFTIGDTSQIAQPFVNRCDDSIPMGSGFIRWFNLLSLSLLVGGIAFIRFIWHPLQVDNLQHVSQRLKQMIWVGWIYVGLSSFMMMSLQTSIVNDSTSLFHIDQMLQMLSGSRFGSLWLIRGGFWLIIGFVLYHYDLHRLRILWVLLLASGVILLTQSLFSHASGTLDALPAIVMDWLHLFAMAIWLGGLVQLVFIVNELRRVDTMVSKTLAYFSNIVRIAVALLVLSGAYAMFTHVGSIGALLTTTYGQLLLLKLILFVPLLLLGGVNLVITTRQLHTNRPIWIGRIRYLIVTEIVLAIVILLAVGLMTAIAPARSTYACKSVSVPEVAQNSFFEMALDDNMMIHFGIEPGIVGENKFYVELFDEQTGDVIEDASLIRLRFQAEDSALGESELRPIYESEGRYKAVGSNLSVPGSWKVRMTIQRPNEFDRVVDFTPTIQTPALPPAIPEVDPYPDRHSRLIALLMSGIAIIVVNMIAFFTQSTRRIQAEVTIISSVCGMLIIGGGFNLLIPTTPTIPQWMDNQPVKLAVNSSIDRPWLVTHGGDILQPDDNQWTTLPTEFNTNAIYIENEDNLWVASDAGLFHYDATVWEQVSELESSAVTSTHGYIYGLGNTRLARIGASILEADNRILDIPQSQANAEQFEMLGNHTHVLLNGGDVFLTSSLGLGWQPLNNPQTISHITTDDDGHLLATSPNSLLRWHWIDGIWSTITALPDEHPVDDIVVFDGQIYILAGGKLFQRQRGEWTLIQFGSAGYITDIAFQYPDHLWVLDSQNIKLFYTDLSGVWKDMDIRY